jgi:hypothetical protein
MSEQDAIRIISQANETLKKASNKAIRAHRILNQVSRIVTTIELCRDGVWEDHKPALDSILRDFHAIGYFELSPSTLKELNPDTPEGWAQVD